MLFLGDVTSRVIRYLIDIRDIEGKYTVIKINHHGTPGHRDMYYCNKLPRANEYLISNSAHKSRKIDNRYFYEGQDIICTYHIHNYIDDEKCQYKKKNQRCRKECSNFMTRIKV